MNRRLNGVIFSVATILVLGGCQSTPQPAGPIAPVAPPVAAVTPSPDPVIDTPQALAAKTQAWTKEIEAMMPNHMKRPGERTDTGGTADFARPEDFRIGPAASAPARKPEIPVTVIPLEKPQVDATPSNANQASALIGGDPRNLDPRGAEARNIAAANAARLLADSSMERRPYIAPKDPAAETGFGPVDQAIGKHLRDSPRDVWAHLDYQLAEFLKDKPVPQLAAMSNLAAEDRELLSTVLDGMSNFRSVIRSDNNMLMWKKVRPLLEMADRLRAQADLVIPTVSLCTRVDGFGVFEPIEPARFTAMREHPVIIYCEVENFSSHLNEKKQWESKLSQEVVLYTETGLPVWQDKTENITDFARRRRHDFFIVKKTRFPANITLGRYLLKVTVVDQNASRVAEATMPVQFVAQ